MLELIISFVVTIVLLNLLVGGYNEKIERDDTHLTEEDDY